MMLNKTLLICSFLLWGTPATGQDSKLLYVEAGPGGGNVFSLKAGLNFVFHKTNVVSLIFYDCYKTSHNAPADYQGGIFEKKPKDIVVTGALMYGKIVTPGISDVRFNLRGGIVLGNITYKSNFRKPTPGPNFYFGASHLYDETTKSTAGIILNPTMELPFTWLFGMAPGLFLIFTPEAACYGLEVNFLLGKVRSRRGS